MDAQDREWSSLHRIPGENTNRNSDTNLTVKNKHENRPSAYLVGACEVNEAFLWDVDMALVIDRRITNDIVTHNYFQQFCNQNLRVH